MSALIRNKKFRYIFCLAVLAISLLLLGAGRMNGEKKSLSRRAANISACRTTCEQLISAVPGEKRAAWQRLVQNSPELALRTGSINLHELDR